MVNAKTGQVYILMLGGQEVTEKEMPESLARELYAKLGEALADLDN